MIKPYPRTLLKRDFFIRPVTRVAPDLIGKLLVFKDKKGLIIETEAYGGKAEPDDSSHAARGITPRCAPMFAIGGTIYVYFTYGMHYCVNISAEEEGVGAAILIRAVITADSSVKTDGPAKLARYFGFDKNANGTDVTENPELSLYDVGFSPEYSVTTRIGISRAKEAPRRYVVMSKSFLNQAASNALK